MIQELLGVSAAGLLSGETKISITSEGFLQTSLSPCPSTSAPPSSAATSTTATASSNPDSQNLRCPRCDSTNTKFCYYNNYNLTQPRHFCKTCRRYWTKGGALRNVPIGGGCRKNRAVSSISTSAGKSSTSSKMKASFEKSFTGTGVDHELSSQSNHPLLWSPPQNSHILALLRAAQNPNPSPLASAFPLKSEGQINGVSYGATQLIPSSAGVSTALWRNNHQQNGVVTGGEVQNSGIQELFQRLKSPTGSYYNGHQPLSLSNNAVSSSNNNTSSILESAPVTAGDFSYFNPPFTWSDVAAPSGAYP